MAEHCRTRTLLTLVIIALPALFNSACESDQLQPVSKFNSDNCKIDNACGDESLHLDSGTGGTPTDQLDAGSTVPPDSGTVTPPPGDSGTGSPADTGLTDPPDGGTSSTPDSGPPPSQFLDLNGTWNTRYVFDLSHYLFGISGIANELDFIDQTFQGNISTGFPPLDAFIISIVQQYVPSWVVDLVSALNTIATLFSQTYVNGGHMTIMQDQPINPSDTSTLLHATETWGEMVVLIVDQCPRGRSDPNWPTCAEHHIPITNNPAMVGPLDILVQTHAFDGVLQAGVPQADFRFDQRVVEIELQKLILLVVDFVVSLTTPYATLHDALSAVVDCHGLGLQARDFAQNTLGLGLVPAIAAQVAVENQCNSVINGIVNGVGGIGVTEHMVFDQLGHAVDQNPQDGRNRPEILQSINVPNTIDGHFSVLIQSQLGGEWEGTP